MNKLAISLFIIATTLFTTACSNNGMYQQNEKSTIENSISSQDLSNTIKIPISIVSKDVKSVKYLEIKEEMSLQEKIQLIINTISKECFNGLPIKVTVYGKDTAKIELIEPKGTTKGRASWKEDYLNESTKEYTINTIIKNIIQEEYKGDWIEKVQLYYEDELIPFD